MSDTRTDSERIADLERQFYELKQIIADMMLEPLREPFKVVELPDLTANCANVRLPPTLEFVDGNSVITVQVSVSPDKPPVKRQSMSNLAQELKPFIQAGVESAVPMSAPDATPLAPPWQPVGMRQDA